MEYGTRLSGRGKPVQRLKTGKIYQVDIQTKSEVCPEEVIDYLLDKFSQRYPQLRVTWIKASGRTIKLQLTPTPQLRAETLAAETIIAWLPSILSLIGVTAVFISLYEIIRAVPWYIWGTLIFGLVMIVWGPSLIKPPRKYK